MTLPLSLSPALLGVDFWSEAGQPWVYAGFIAVVIILLILDLTVFHRKAHAVSMKEALGWSAFWISLALLFSIAVYFIYESKWAGFGVAVPQLGGGEADVGGWRAVQLYLTGYLIEESLSMDNLFVMAVIFGYFGVPAQYQHRVLFWGILTAVVLRGIMIWIGATLVHEFEWIIYVFGAFLLYTAYKMARGGHEEVNPEHNPAVKLVRKLFPVTPEYHGQRFFTRESSQFPGKLAATPLLLALVMIETADVIFAVDSIPAIFAITADPFIVFTSNIFAILGLRALFFCLAALMDKFRYLKAALVIILAFIGGKMLALAVGIHLAPTASLVIVLSVLIIGVVASWLFPKPAEESVVP